MPLAPVRPSSGARCFAALAGAAFRRYSTYRQAMIAGAFTNVVFGAMVCYVMIAVARAGGRPGGYDQAQLVTFVWVGQGLLNVVWLWGWTELADRVRTGDVVADLLRPVDPLFAYAAADTGRFAYAALTRFVIPVAFGLLFFQLYLPEHAVTYLLFAVSAVLAAVISFGGRYLVNLSAFRIIDIRGPHSAWLISAGVLSGSFFPLRFLPEWGQWLLWCGTPFPSLFQVPLDILVERTDTLTSLAMLALQAAWAGALIALCVAVQRRAVRHLVVQGG